MIHKFDGLIICCSKKQNSLLDRILITIIKDNNTVQSGKTLNQRIISKSEDEEKTLSHRILVCAV